MDRKYSDPEIWHISIDHDDAPDGSDGGYGKHGAYIPPEAMKEIVASRKLLIEKDEVIQRLRKLEKEYEKLRRFQHVSGAIESVFCDIDALLEETK